MDHLPFKPTQHEVELMALTDETILVTGATSGIGNALVRALADRGNRIIAVGRDHSKLDVLRQQPGVAMALACDLSSRHHLFRLIDDIDAKGLAVSCLINNAAIQNTPSFVDDDFDFDGIEAEVTINFTAVAWLTSLVLPMLAMQSGGGAIINISSGLALSPKAGSAVYCATKAGIHSLSQSLRYQLAPSDISVHEVLLPIVDTPMTEGRGRGKISPEAAARSIIEGIVRGRDEIYVGKARLLPILNRISPALVRRVMQRM